MAVRIARGFTLIEVITVVLIIAVLAAIAIPAYVDQVRKSRRAEAQSVIQAEVLRLEKWRVDNPSYAGYGLSSAATDGYAITLTNTAPTTYTLTATPGGDQAKDKCGTLSLAFSAGVTTKTPASAECW